MTNRFNDSWRPEDTGLPLITGTTYYVDASTTGTEVGTLENPFRTLSQVNAQSLADGDAMLFKRGETWTGQLRCAHSGSETDRNVWGAYGEGERPIITVVEEQTLGWTFQSDNIWKCTTNNPTYNPKRIKRNGLEILSMGTELGEALGDTIPDLVEWKYEGDELYVYGDPTNDTFEYSSYDEVIYDSSENSYNDFYGLELVGGYSRCISLSGTQHCAFTYMKVGAMSYYGVYTEWNGTDYLDIKNCVIDSEWTLNYKEAGIDSSSVRGAYEGLRFSKDATYINIQNNYIKNWHHAGINMWADLTSSRLMQYIDISENVLTSPDIPYGNRIAMQGNTQDYEIHHNICHDQIGSRWQLGSERGHIHHNIFKDIAKSLIDGGEGHAIRFGNDIYKETLDCIVENNIFYNTKPGGIDIGATRAFEDGGGLRDVIIQNNIFYDCVDENYGTSGVPIYVRSGNLPEYTKNISILNNIAYSAVSTRFGRMDAEGASDVTQFEIDVNSVGENNIASGNITADALFTDAENYIFTLIGGSHAIGTGLVPTSTVDYDGNSIIQGSTGVGYDMGIYDQFKLRTAYSIKVTLPDDTVYIYTDDRAGDRHLYIDSVEQATPDEITGNLTLDYVSQLTGGNVDERTEYKVYDGILTP